MSKIMYETAMTRRAPVHADRHLVIIGAGVVGSCFMDVLPREFQFRNVTVLDKDEPKPGHIPDWAAFSREMLTKDNYTDILAKYLKPSDVCLNLSVLESADLMVWCQEHSVLYLDTSGEIWDAPNKECITMDRRNKQHYFALNGIQKHRVAVQSALQKKYPSKTDWPTAVLYHGMNPGIVNHCMKRSLLDLAAAILNIDAVQHKDADFAEHQAAVSVVLSMQPTNFAKLAQVLEVKIIHVAERDTQVSEKVQRKSGEFVSTWSVDGFWEELQMYSELCLGTHERCIPANSVHWSTPPHSVALGSKGANTKIFSWVPSGPTLGFLTTHDEVLTMGDFLSIRTKDEVSGKEILEYRPTILFSYMPCDASVASIHEMVSRGYEKMEQVFLNGDDISSGKDEVGILLLGHRLGGWWTGSTMSIEDARKVLPGHSPTTIQVIAGVVGSLHWMLQHPSSGICTPEHLPHEDVLAKAMPYLEPFVSVQSPFNPLQHPLFHFYDYENTFGSIEKEGDNWMPDPSQRWQLPASLQGPRKLIPSPYYNDKPKINFTVLEDIDDERKENILMMALTKEKLLKKK
jgi:homospermidine synthase